MQVAIRLPPLHRKSAERSREELRNRKGPTRLHVPRQKVMGCTLVHLLWIFRPKEGHFGDPNRRTFWLVDAVSPMSMLSFLCQPDVCVCVCKIISEYWQRHGIPSFPHQKQEHLVKTSTRTGIQTSARLYVRLMIPFETSTVTWPNMILNKKCPPMPALHL